MQLSRLEEVHRSDLPEEEAAVALAALLRGGLARATLRTDAEGGRLVGARARGVGRWVGIGQLLGVREDTVDVAVDLGRGEQPPLHVRDRNRVPLLLG